MVTRKPPTDDGWWEAQVDWRELYFELLEHYTILKLIYEVRTQPPTTEEGITKSLNNTIEVNNAE